MASRSWSATPIPAVPAPENDHALVAQRRPADAHGGDGRRQRDGAGALHIVVEDADPVAYFSRIRRPLPGAKSSHCNNALGNSLVATLT